MSSDVWLEESPGGLSKCCSIRWPAAGPVAGLHRGWKRSPLCGRSFDSPRAEWIHILSGSQGDRRGGCTSMPPLGLFPPEVGQLAVGMCLHARPASSVHKLAVVTMGRTGVLFGRVLGLRQQRQRGLGASQVGSTAQVQTVHLIESWATGRWALLPAGSRRSSVHSGT